jgi:hypothetical protein
LSSRSLIPIIAGIDLVCTKETLPPGTVDPFKFSSPVAYDGVRIKKGHILSAKSRRLLIFRGSTAKLLQYKAFLAFIQIIQGKGQRLLQQGGLIFDGNTGHF